LISGILKLTIDSDIKVLIHVLLTLASDHNAQVKNKKFRDVVVIFLSLTKSCDNASAIRFRQFNNIIHITDNTLLLLDDNGKRKILLANYPVLASGVNAIRWLLLGNKEKISNN
jgi:hypothetical protein